MNSFEPKQLTKQEDLKQFTFDKTHALISLDEGVIHQFCDKWGLEMPSEADAFWTGVHLARALDLNIPRDKRGDSALWLAKKEIDLKDYLD